MGQGVPRQGHDTGGHRPPRAPRHHLRDERRELPRTQGAREKALGGPLDGERQPTMIDAAATINKGGTRASIKMATAATIRNILHQERIKMIITLPIGRRV